MTISPRDHHTQDHWIMRSSHPRSLDHQIVIPKIIGVIDHHTQDRWIMRSRETTPEFLTTISSDQPTTPNRRTTPTSVHIIGAYHRLIRILSSDQQSIPSCYQNIIRSACSRSSDYTIIVSSDHHTQAHWTTPSCIIRSSNHQSSDHQSSTHQSTRSSIIRASDHESSDHQSSNRQIINHQGIRSKIIPSSYHQASQCSYHVPRLPQGDALLFWDMNLVTGKGDRRSLHASCPTLKVGWVRWVSGWVG